MTNEYAEIIACAQRIGRMVGPEAHELDKLALSGRLPGFPETNLNCLLSGPIYDRLDLKTKSRLSSLLRESLDDLQDRMSKRYLEMCNQLHTASDSGLADFDVETRLLQTVEFRYRHCVDDIRAILRKLLARAPSVTDSRNTRGGFGDVSTPP